MVEGLPAASTKMLLSWLPKFLFQAIEQGAPKVIPGLLGAKTSNSKCFLEASEGT